MDPANQITDVKNEWTSELLQLYEPFFIDKRCIEIMEKPMKMRADFNSFINERGKIVQEYIAQNWGFATDTQQVEDEEEI